MQVGAIAAGNKFFFNFFILIGVQLIIFCYFLLKGLLSVRFPSEIHLVSIRKCLLSVDFPHKSPPFCRKAHSFCQVTPEITSFLSERTFFPSGCTQKTAFFLSGIPQKQPPFCLKAPSFCQAFLRKSPPFCQKVSSFCQFSFRNHLLFVTKCLLSVRFPYEISFLS